MGVVWSGILVEARKRWPFPTSHYPEPDIPELPWLDFSGADLKHCDFTRCSIRGVDFHGTRLYGASFRKDRITAANFDEAEIGVIDLQNARLETVTFRRASSIAPKLEETDFTDCDFTAAHLFRAHGNVSFTGGNATAADFTEADLSNARFDGINLTGATFAQASLEKCVWQPRGVPDAVAISQANELETLTYANNESALVQLRKALEDAGTREAERKVNCALQRARVNALWDRSYLFWSDAPVADWLEALLRKLLFDYTCDYGLARGRPLRLVAYLILICTLPYAFIILCARRAPHTPAGSPAVSDSLAGAIWAVPLEKRVATGTSNPVLVRVDTNKSGRIRGALRAIALGLFFSVISAFSVGYRDLDVGRWIERIKREESTLRATGWVRTVSGFQALVSFYLLVLWVLIYFGRPFE